MGYLMNKKLMKKLEILLNEVEELDFVYCDSNYSIEVVSNHHSFSQYKCYIVESICFEHIDKKYISKESAEFIMKQMNELIDKE